MKNTRRFISAVMALAMVSALAPMSVTAADSTKLTLTKEDPYDALYIVTIPADTTVTDTGWTSLGNVTAKYNGEKTFDPANEWKLASSDAETKIGYTLKSAQADTEATTEWEFSAAEVTTAGTSKPVGIDVSATDYEAAAAATYTDTITFNIAVEDVVKAVDLSTLTAAYEAKDGDILTGTISDPSYQITIADGATVTLKNVNISLTSGQTFSAITPLGNATIVLDGENYVKGADYQFSAGVASKEGKTLTIRGTGTLTAIGTNGSGIGEAYGKNAGNIVIESGTINATGKDNNPGIGAPNNGNSET